MSLHRVEAVRHGDTPAFEYWSNPYGDVTICREKDEDVWYAMIDGIVVRETMEPIIGFTDQTVQRNLQAKSARGLAHLLAMQTGIHILFDDAAPIAVPELEAS